MMEIPQLRLFQVRFGLGFFFGLFKMGPQLSFYYRVGQLKFVGDHVNRHSHTRDVSFRVREQ